MRQLTRILLTAAVVTAVAAACGGDDGEVVAGGAADSTTTTVDPDTPVSSPPLTDDGTDTTTTWSRIEPTPDLVDPIPATPDELVPDPDDPDAVLVRFYGGVQECYGARATVVEQGADEVRIRLEVGGQPDLPPGTACIEIAEAQELQVVLDAPVADRTLTPVTS